MMKHGGKMMVGISLALGVGVVAGYADVNTAATPYQPIIDRNIFALKPPPPPPDPASEKPPPPKITLTGIATILGKKLALMKTPPEPVKQGESSKGEHFYTLTEGQRDGELQVVKIDEKAQTVEVTFGGSPFTLNFTDNGVKGSATTGAPPPSGNPFGQPGGIPSPTGGRPFPPRAMRLPTPNGSPGAPVPVGENQAPSSSAGIGGAPTVAANGVALPGFGSNPTQNLPQNGIDPSVANMEPEAYAALLEVERERTKQQVLDGTMPPLPTTRYTPPGAVGSLEEAPQPTVPNQQPTGPMLRRAPSIPPPLFPQ